MLEHEADGLAIHEGVSHSHHSRVGGALQNQQLRSCVLQDFGPGAMRFEKPFDHHLAVLGIPGLPHLTEGAPAELLLRFGITGLEGRLAMGATSHGGQKLENQKLVAAGTSCASRWLPLRGAGCAHRQGARIPGASCASQRSAGWANRLLKQSRRRAQQIHRASACLGNAAAGRSGGRRSST